MSKYSALIVVSIPSGGNGKPVKGETQTKIFLDYEEGLMYKEKNKNFVIHFSKLLRSNIK